MHWPLESIEQAGDRPLPAGAGTAGSVVSAGSRPSGGWLGPNWARWSWVQTQPTALGVRSS